MLFTHHPFLAPWPNKFLAVGVGDTYSVVVPVLMILHDAMTGWFSSLPITKRSWLLEACTAPCRRSRWAPAAKNLYGLLGVHRRREPHRLRRHGLDKTLTAESPCYQLDKGRQGRNSYHLRRSSNLHLLAQAGRVRARILTMRTQSAKKRTNYWQPTCECA